ncbi:MAG: BamA/TamA family outer membrane protein [Fuerstiella sp.]|nr:BamA/TamA family outer membrane protein [Fuerstiella sp.]
MRSNLYSSPHRPQSDGRAFALLRAVAVLLTTIVGVAIPLCAQELPEAVVAIRIEGNETIPQDAIRANITTQPGRNITNRQVREDKRNLMSTRWFYNVNERFEPTDDGVVLIFTVHERPIVRRVEYRGINKLKLKELASWTNLKKGSPFDHMANRDAVHRIEQEYRERGFNHIKVTLETGGDPSDRDVIFRINEGPKVRVQHREFQFKGPQQSGDITSLFSGRKSQDGTVGLSPSAGRLRTKLETKEALFGLFGGLFKPETMQQDIASLKQYYRSLGFFDVEVEAKPLFSSDRSSVKILYTINEGIPFKIRNITVNGNNVIPGKQLRQNAQLRPGQYFNSLPLSKDVQQMLDQYGDRGHYFASVVPVPQFTEKAGELDLVFEIDEDRPRYVRNINPTLQGDHPHTMEVVPLNQFQMEPGDLANPKLIRRGRSRINGSGLFEGVQVEVIPVDPNQTMPASMSRTIRGQSGAGYTPAWTQLFDVSKPITRSTKAPGGHTFPSPAKAPEQSRTSVKAVNQQVSLLHDPDMPSVVKYRTTQPTEMFYRPQSSLLVSSFASTTHDDIVVRGQSPQGDFYPDPGRGNAMLEGSPYNNQFEALPPGWVDINIDAAEGRTGRLMFGAGVNSDAGIVGSFVWDERNFNLFAPPRTFADIIEGRAWRGGGQRFRAEAAPGDQVSRYALSWTDPYFLYTDYSLSLSGFYFNRFYPDWDETRLGGRVALGKQLTPEWSINGALRLEDVEITRVTIPTPPALASVVGNNFLSTFRTSVSHDTRDSTLMPGEGHFVDLAYEQAFGDFNYPRFDTEMRQYITMHSRPDGSGRQVMTFAGNLGWSGDSTPVFERYFAGGFQSFRGFAFRGVTPRVGGVAVGGTWQMLGTVEYRVPVTADDMINVVAFSDVGTVEPDVSIDNFRVTVGVGLRVVVPAMGPVPLAFDFGFPIKSSPFDDERIFSFYVGINR